VGAVLIPLMLAARISSLTAGAALLLGASIGGELLNAGAPEFATIITSTADAAQKLNLAVPPVTSFQINARMLPLNLTHLVVATLAFWLISLREEKKHREQLALSDDAEAGETGPVSLRVNPLKAAVPLLPLVILFFTGPPLQLIHIPDSWLIGPKDTPEAFNSRLIGVAMLIGVAVAALTSWRNARETAKVFFDGAGFAFANIVSLIVTANCFAEGVKLIGIAELISHAISAAPGLLYVTAGLFPLAFGALCGSGMAATQGLCEFFVGPALKMGIDPAHVGSVVSLGAAAGRTMSPIAAVTLMCASLTNTNPVDLTKRVAPPLILGIAAVIVLATLTAAR
jgi:C4-dicarboxylate transporter, DcuC family